MRLDANDYKRRGLKECPWCGTAPMMTDYVVSTGGGDERRCYKIECMAVTCPVRPAVIECGPHGYRQDNDLPSDAAAEAEVVRRWNDRHERRTA